MDTDIIGLNYNTSTVGITSGSTTSTTSTTSTSSTADADATQSGDSAQFSKGAATMQKLKALQSSDPTKFKEVAQKISDQLASAAKNSSDSKESKFLSDMSSKFASAAQSGSMDSLAPPKPDNNAATMQVATSGSQAAQKYGGQGPSSSTFNTIDNIISDALSGTDSTSA